MNWLIWLGVALVLVWALVWLVLHVASAAIHLLLIAGVVVVGWWAVQHFLARRPTTV